MWADHETSIDLLGIGYLKDAVLEIIKNSELLPATIGIFGDWGSGKSSLIKMIVGELDLHKDILVLEFNGWLFEGYDDAKSALMETLVDDLIQRIPEDKKKDVKRIALRLLRKINWLRLGGKAIKYGVAAATTGGIGVLTSALSDLPTLAKKAGELLEEVDQEKLEGLFEEETKQIISRNIRSFRAEFEELIEKSGFSAVVVIIDDLDRCLPDTIIETLEAIRLFLYVPKTAFIIGADERLVKYAVRNRFPELPGDRTDVGRDYLEKLIQYAVRIPPMTRADTVNYITLLFLQGKISEEKFNECIEWITNPETIHEGKTFSSKEISEIVGDLSDELREDLVLAQRIGPVLGVGLNGNPRQCKRFLNTLVMRIRMAKSRGIELQRRVLAKLMLLEYFRPQFFRSLSGWQSAQEGIPEQLKLMEEAATSLPENGSKSKDEKDKKFPEIEMWSQDQWIVDWLNTEPFLSAIDLRPYFYFSREKLTDISESVKRLTPEAQTILRELFSQSDAIRNNAFKKGKNISQSDAATILDVIIERVRNTEDHSDKNSPLGIAVEWIKVRPELSAEFMSFISTLPDAELPIWIVTGLETALKNTPQHSALIQFLERISNSTTAGNSLKKAAQNRLKSLRGET
jgi:predicted KAP-like P-loop ATPase